MLTKKIFLRLFFLTFIAIYSFSCDVENRAKEIEESNQAIPEETLNSKTTNRKADNNCPGENPNFSLEFFKTNNSGEKDERGINHVIIFNPKSEQLDFKVNVGLAHELYLKHTKGKTRQEYIPKTFREIISEDNAKLKGQLPIAAINSDYIDTLNKPQGLNISRGIDYAGDFRNKRSSFGISGGIPSQRRATLQTGRRKEDVLNYNLVGGNGRFYRDGVFKDICDDLGEFACKQVINRSMVAVTSTNYVILLVNDAKANSNISISENNQELLPNQFNQVLEGIASKNCLGKIQEAMLFDGGMSPGLYYNNQIYVENPGPIGSVFLIYKKSTTNENK